MTLSLFSFLIRPLTGVLLTFSIAPSMVSLAQTAEEGEELPPSLQDSESKKKPIEEVRHSLHWVIDSSGASKKTYVMEYRGKSTTQRVRKFTPAGDRTFFRQLLPALDPMDRRSFESLQEGATVKYRAEYQGKIDMKIAESRMRRGVYTWLPNWSDPIASQVIKDPASKVKHRWRPLRVVQVLTLKMPWKFVKLQKPIAETLNVNGLQATLEAGYEDADGRLKIKAVIDSPKEVLTLGEKRDLNRAIFKWTMMRLSGAFLFSGKDVERDRRGRPQFPRWDLAPSTSMGLLYLDLDGASYFSFYGLMGIHFDLRIFDFLYWRVADLSIDGTVSKGFSMASLSGASELGLRFSFFGGPDSSTRNFVEFSFRPEAQLPFVFKPSHTVTRDRLYPSMGAQVAFGAFEPYPFFPTKLSPVTVRIFLRYRRFINVPGLENQYILGVEAY